VGAGAQGQRQRHVAGNTTWPGHAPQPRMPVSSVGLNVPPLCPGGLAVMVSFPPAFSSPSSCVMKGFQSAYLQPATLSDHHCP
jgi:hypothetical protein